MDIDIQNVGVYGLNESAIASGYPMRTDLPRRMSIMTGGDLSRAKRLSHGNIGEGHDNFLNGIIVQFDLTAPIKMWTEAQRYHFLDFVSSASTMHRLAKFDLDNEEVFDENVVIGVRKILKDLQSYYQEAVAGLENAKARGDAERIAEAKTLADSLYLQLLMNCPVGLRLTARMTTNYRQLKTIYHQRKNHRLPHWHRFCDWIKELPQSSLITGE